MSGVFLHKGRPYHFADISKKLAVVKRQLPAILTTAAINHFKQSFRYQGFTDKHLEKWPPRKPNAPRNSGRGILMNTGYLRNSIRTGRMTFAISEVATDAPYASIHNEGYDGPQSVRGHTRRKRRTGTSHYVRAHTRTINMPQRQFMGNSEVMENEFERLIDQRVMSIFD